MTPPRRNRVMVMALLLALAIALIFPLRTCFQSQDGFSSYEEFAQLETAEAGQQQAGTIPPALPLSQKAGRGKDREDQAYPAQPTAKASLESVQPSVSEGVQDMAFEGGESDSSEPEQGLDPVMAGITPGESTPHDGEDEILSMQPPQDIEQLELMEIVPANVSLKDEPATEKQKKSAAAAAEVVEKEEVQPSILITFSFDSDDLISDSQLALDKAAAMLRENSDSIASITGFTDSQGDQQYNLALSRKRAAAVERYLVGVGIARERLHVEGRGVLTDPVEGQVPGLENAMAPYRIVHIKLGSDG